MTPDEKKREDQKKPSSKREPTGERSGRNESDRRSRSEELHKKLKAAPRPTRSPLLMWILLIFVAIVGWKMYVQNQPTDVEIDYSRLMEEVRSSNISSISIDGRLVIGELSTPAILDYEDGLEIPFTQFRSWLLSEDPEFIHIVEENNPGATISGQAPATNWGGILFSVLPIAVIIAFWIFIMRSMRGGSGPGKAFSFGKSNARLLTEDRPDVTFDNVAGLPEAKQELQEIVEFLKNPQKFQRLGGKIPKGALLIGPPGTGKTLLAKAVAGEAAVPFLSISGSDFVEMFVGVGASRVRDLFEQGKANAPCIIFIDEMDAVGRTRGSGLGGGHDEREQTLNQLLVEMDGFESNEGVILLAATNRPDVLDPALLRPGRFDRQIIIDRPDFRGREGILKVSAKGVTVGDDVDYETLAKGTPGLSGADLANLVNEAALLAARSDRDAVMMTDFEEAKDKVMLGTERKSMILTKEEIRNTAYHEAGHALVSWLIPGSDPIHKVTIIPRGHTLGVTYFLPIDERHSWPRHYCLDGLANVLGGRAAEKIVFDEITTGAAQDLRVATDLARQMVCEWGMSEKLGPVTFGREERQIFLGREIARSKEISEATAVIIDEEIKRLVNDALTRARKLLEENRDKLDLLAGALLERETLSGADVDELFGKTASANDSDNIADPPRDTGDRGGDTNRDSNDTGQSGAQG